MVEGHRQIRPDRSQLDKELVERVKKGDQTAYAELVDAYNWVYYALAMGYVHNHHKAEDIVQDGFIEIYQCLHSLREHARFGSFGYTIVRRLCIKAIEKEKSEPMVMSDLSTIELNQAITSLSKEDKNAPLKIRAEHEEIIKTIYELPDLPRQIGMLFFFGELKYKQISQLLNISDKSVEMHLYRVRKYLQEKLRGKI